jgi:hypothetical protein
MINAADASAMQGLLIEWAYRFDRGGVGTLHELMVDEPTIDFATKHIGRNAVAEWAAVRSNLTGTRRHVLTNFRFREIEDGRIEGTTTCMTFVHEEGARAELPKAVGDYIDVFARVDGAWKFESRRFISVFSRIE